MRRTSGCAATTSTRRLSLWSRRAVREHQRVTAALSLITKGPLDSRPLEQWDFSIVGEVDEPKRWTWEEFMGLPSEEVTRDIHCVTKWSKLGTR